ncbi:hypothetical protein QYE76_035138 [Lolium multiflorum]|uniref:AP2/ERF domain-containing protein n=1 Tax=Lolium multiflorum TaxID=4521 RepID=A0AAD8VNQ7_LOLMU|nr:hypothetical protein QYE76_035138 [Lolium multiflorum]
MRVRAPLSPPSPPPATTVTAMYGPPPCTAHHRRRHHRHRHGPPPCPHHRHRRMLPPPSPPSPPPCTGHRHRLATTVTAMYGPPPCTAHHHHRHVQATVATATAGPPPSPPCTGHRRVLPTTATAMYGHHRHRHTCPFPVPRVAAASTCLARHHRRARVIPLPRATPRRFPAPPVAAASTCHAPPLPRATCRCRYVPRPAASPRHMSPNLSRCCAIKRRVRADTSPSPPFIRRRDAAAPSRLVRLRGVRARPNCRFYAEMRAGGFRLTLGTYNTPELAARAYDAAAWRFRRPRCDMNFPDVESLEEAEFLAPTPCLVDDEDRRRHLQVQRRIAIAEHDEELMRQWRAQFPNDVDNTAVLRSLRAQRRSNSATVGPSPCSSSTTRIQLGPTTTLGGTTFGPRQPPTTSRSTRLVVYLF